jgi:hypothetical protein
MKNKVAVLTPKTKKNKTIKQSKKIVKKIDNIVNKIEKQIMKLTQLSQGLYKLRSKVLDEQKAA